MKYFAAVAALLCAMLLFTFALADTSTAELISCEYSIFGGMENEDITYTAKQGDTRWDATLAVAEHGIVKEYHKLVRDRIPEIIEASGRIRFRKVRGSAKSLGAGIWSIHTHSSICQFIFPFHPVL